MADKELIQGQKYHLYLACGKEMIKNLHMKWQVQRKLYSIVQYKNNPLLLVNLN
jgi:hypothetical protein